MREAIAGRMPRAWRLPWGARIGVALVADGLSFHIPRAYIYSAIVFSAAVEAFNVLAKRNRRKHKALRQAADPPR